MIKNVRLTGHAVDRASVRLLDRWLKWRRMADGEPEGLHSWLTRVAVDAINNGDTYTSRAGFKIVQHKKIKFVFEQGDFRPGLLSVMSLDPAESKNYEIGDGAKNNPQQAGKGDPKDLEGGLVKDEKGGGKIRKFYNFIRRMVGL